MDESREESEDGEDMDLRDSHHFCRVKVIPVA